MIVIHGITLRFLRLAGLGLGKAALGDPLGAQGAIHHMVGRQHREIIA